MGHVISGLAISVDGYIAGPGDGAEAPLGQGGNALFDWYVNGDQPSRVFPDFRMAEPSRALFDEMAGQNGAIITGRRTYDIANAWGGNGPQPGVPLFILTHHAPADVPSGAATYRFITEGGIERAVDEARASAGGRNISLMGSAAVQQGLRAGLLDELVLDVVPILLGGGVRLLTALGESPIALDLLRVVPAPGVTHLHYRVNKEGKQ